jgi:phosphatidylserine decarboxylase
MATSSVNNPGFMTPDQLIERWQGQVASATLASWRSRNSGPPYVKVGGRVLYKAADVEAWEERNKRGHK